MSLSATDIHGRLDAKGLLADSRGAGAYALEVTTPDHVEGVARAFFEAGVAEPPHEALSRLTAADVAYVGGSKDVYARLQDHGNAEVRRATFLEAFEVVDVLDVWPSETPFREERTRARVLSREGWAVWSDGEIY